MQKIKTATILSIVLLLVTAPATPFMADEQRSSPPIITEMVFVNMVRDMELLNHWLLDKDYSKEIIETLYNQNCQKIFALYEVDPLAFQASTNHYLAHSVERALKVYKQIYVALDLLIAPI